MQVFFRSPLAQKRIHHEEESMVYTATGRGR